ncbi:ADI_G0021230.mRNA.1.CDS.1 [Saccharomyces cerevisiae]|uniref:Putative uncharacterized protein YGL074C n=1 Tax=Saccharomyces cerevisiae (strain ATCC 204508 / S288c) TaxID=559292 RepID=YGH4_YEAST|nr:RecName: Full=Putative uncharacterized protein YGL074C [Saccharomyces cerevisiae S288C]KZV11152.1 hypothetical protein WN66_02327 [Saccharomyces cerevisiae]QHB08576.1 hypothetical protein SCEN_G01980 [Saccharomyces cerevisiae]CAA96776.1 unnamed protein product [Saccharomyces cerevisiae]CAI4511284.1 ADI_G0021230.mRNA.1.CDS.1 [Saccharomyces cerevisiae]CAI6514662.1 CMF_HP1_G0019440.mRNA.1.CDS.1 [Saccharomyces cerevisiae]
MAVEDVVLASVRSVVKISFGCKIFSMSSSFKLGKGSIRGASLTFDSLVVPVFAALFMAPTIQLSFCLFCFLSLPALFVKHTSNSLPLSTGTVLLFGICCQVAKSLLKI